MNLVLICFVVLMCGINVNSYDNNGRRLLSIPKIGIKHMSVGYKNDKTLYYVYLKVFNLCDRRRKKKEKVPKKPTKNKRRSTRK